MTPLLKDPASVLSYTIAWPASLIAGAAISGASWSVEPQTEDGLAVAGHFIDGGDTGAHFSGGRPGRVYRARCHVELSDGRSADRSLVIRLERL